MMFFRLGKMLVVIALAATLGAHWALLQTVAWTSMLADNLQSCSFRDAVVKTFDGKHPCCLCKAIAAGKKSEKKNEFTSQMQKLEYTPMKGNVVLIPPTQSHLLSLEDLVAESFTQEPLTPPPRGCRA
jgi:hypothetical protein